jgi:hypothetical protein
VKDRFTPGEREVIYQTGIRQLRLEHVARIRERQGAIARATEAARTRRLLIGAAGGISRQTCTSDLIWRPSLW